MPGITGTRDQFGIGRNFYHEGKEITTHREWDKAGYVDAHSDPALNHDTKEMMKEKTARRKREGTYENRSRLLNGLFAKSPGGNNKKTAGSGK